MLRPILRFSSLAVIALLCSQTAVQSQVGLSPLVLELQENLGQANAVISIDNSSDQEFRARVYPQPFTYDPEQGFQTLNAIANDLTPYLQFSPRELVVPPKRSRLVRLLVRFPPSLPDGEYRTAIFTENLTETSVLNGQGTEVRVGTRVGTAVYVRKGNVSANLTVEGASFDKQHHDIRLLVQDTGQASARPKTEWTLKQGESVITKGTLPATTVIAGSKRSLGLDYPPKQSSLSPGNYQLIGQLSWGGEESNQKTLPFNLSFTVPAKAVSSSH